MRILQIRRIPLGQLPPEPLLLLLPHPALLRLLIPPPIHPNIIPLPGTNQHKLQPQRHPRADRARHVRRRVLRFENLAPRHVPHAVAQEGGGRDDGLLRAARDVAGDQRPGEEEREHVGDRDEVEAPLRPLRVRAVGQHGEGDEADEGRDDGRGHYGQAPVGDAPRVEAYGEEEEEGDDWGGVVVSLMGWGVLGSRLDGDEPERGMSTRRTCRRVKPKEVYMMLPKVVMPLGDVS